MGSVPSMLRVVSEDKISSSLVSVSFSFSLSLPQLKVHFRTKSSFSMLMIDIKIGMDLIASSVCIT